MEDLSIFITTHITNEIHNIALNLCIANIRNHYKDNKIFIINDNSQSNIINIKDIHNKELITLIDSDIKGSGEFLFLYYYHKLEPSKKALYIHDSMFLISAISEEIILELNKIKFLLSFSNNHKIKEQDKLILKLNEGMEIIKNEDWVGCFGGSCLITLEYLKELEETYNIFSLLSFITCRSDREIYERIFGAVICYDLKKKEIDISNISIYGDLYEYYEKYPKEKFHNFKYYLNGNREEMPPLLKLNFGR